MHASNVVCAEGGGAEHVWIKKELHKYESVPRPMSMMVDLCSVSDWDFSLPRLSPWQGTYPAIIFNFNFICTEDDLSGSGLDFAAEPEVDMKGIKITIDKRAESLIVSQQFSFQFLIGQALIGSLSNGEDDGGSEIAIQSNFISSIWTFPICEL